MAKNKLAYEVPVDGSQEFAAPRRKHGKHPWWKGVLAFFAGQLSVFIGGAVIIAIAATSFTIGGLFKMDDSEYSGPINSDRKDDTILSVILQIAGQTPQTVEDLSYYISEDTIKSYLGFTEQYGIDLDYDTLKTKTFAEIPGYLTSKATSTPVADILSNLAPSVADNALLGNLLYAAPDVKITNFAGTPVSGQENKYSFTFSNRSYTDNPGQDFTFTADYDSASQTLSNFSAATATGITKTYTVSISEEPTTPTPTPSSAVKKNEEVSSSDDSSQSSSDQGEPEEMPLEAGIILLDGESTGYSVNKINVDSESQQMTFGRGMALSLSGIMGSFGNIGSMLSSLCLADVLGEDAFEAGGSMEMLKPLRYTGIMSLPTELFGLTLGELLGIDANTEGIMGKLAPLTINDLKGSDIATTLTKGLKISEVMQIDSSNKLLSAIGDCYIALPDNPPAGAKTIADFLADMKISDVLDIETDSTKPGYSKILYAIKDFTLNTMGSSLNTLTIGEIIDCEGNKLLTAISTFTLTNIGTGISGLKLEDVIEIETDPTKAGYNKILASLGESTLTNIGTDMSALMFYDIFEDQMVDSVTGEVTGVWKYLLFENASAYAAADAAGKAAMIAAIKDPSTGYTLLGGLPTMIANMTGNMSSATIGALASDGLIGGLTNDQLETEVDGTKIKNLTLAQLIEKFIALVEEVESLQSQMSSIPGIN